MVRDAPHEAMRRDARELGTECEGRYGGRGWGGFGDEANDVAHFTPATQTRNDKK